MRAFILHAATAIAVCGCGGGQLTVQVQPPADRPKAGFHVQLAPPEQLCRQDAAGAVDGESVSVVTDEAGTARVETSRCGAKLLLIGARGYGPARVQLDPCERSDVTIAMHEAPDTKLPRNSCASAALKVVEAWLSADATALRHQLVDATEVDRYLRWQNAPDPWKLGIDAATRHGTKCSVALRLFYETGCEEAWELELARPRGRWQLQELKRGTL